MFKIKKSKPADNAVRNTNTDLSRLYQTGAVTVYILVALPFCAKFTMPYFAEWYLKLLLLVLYVGCALAGYGLQLLGARLLHLNRKEQVFTYEDTTRRYRPEQAILVHVGAVPIFFLTMRLGWLLLFHFGHYDVYSIVPYSVALFAFGMTELGGYLWFIPYSTLISMRRIGTVGVILFINCIMTFSGPTSLFGVLNLTALCLTIALFVLLLNQNFITRSYGGKIARGINDEAKVYSARVVGIALGCVAAASVLVTSLIAAIVKLFYGIVKFCMAGLASVNGVDDREIKEIYQQDLAGEALKLPRGQADYWVVVFALLSALCVFILCILFIPGLRDKMREVWAYLKEVFWFFFRPRSEWHRGHARREYLNFVDVIEQTQSASKQAIRHADTIKTYTDFKRQLDALPGSDDKIRYAYAVAAAQLRHQRCGVGLSDTPREIARKVRERGLVEDIDRLTADFERLQYENAPLDHSGEVTLERLCTLIRAYL